MTEVEVPLRKKLPKTIGMTYSCGLELATRLINYVNDNPGTNQSRVTREALTAHLDRLEQEDAGDGE